jgi:hypothetical protein
LAGGDGFSTVVTERHRAVARFARTIRQVSIKLGQHGASPLGVRSMDQHGAGRLLERHIAQRHFQRIAGDTGFDIRVGQDLADQVSLAGIPGFVHGDWFVRAHQNLPSHGRAGQTVENISPLACISVYQRFLRC